MNVNIKLGFGMILFFILFGLKLASVINWSWWWVTLPLWWWVPVSGFCLMIYGLGDILEKRILK